MENETCFLLIVKNEHKYMFKYKAGNEKNLFLGLIEYGKDNNHNICLIEVLNMIRKISEHLREKGYLRRHTFHVTPEEIEE